MEIIAYIYSHDGDEHGIRFDVKICSAESLRATVRNHLYPDTPEDGGEDNITFDGIFAILQEQGGYDFEDGWIVIRRGAKEIVEFLMYQLREAKDEERFADERRFEELQRRQAAEAKYAQLQAALIAALGPNAPEVAAKAAA